MPELANKFILSAKPHRLLTPARRMIKTLSRFRRQVRWIRSTYHRSESSKMSVSPDALPHLILIILLFFSIPKRQLKD